jgi:voltage-gated sodium channel
MLTAFFILCAFALDICESQFLPVQGSRSGFIFFILDAILTILFTLELLLNIFAHSNNGFEPFYSKGTNWFDAAIVVISVCNVIVTASGGELPNAKLLRLLRLGRAVKLFKTLKELNRLITSVSKAVLPVCNAFLILFIIAAIYAILGTNFFGEQSPEFFLNFKTSLFTMFQVLSGDGWSDLARSLFARDETDTSGIRKTDNSVAFFFVSYMLINSIMLLNVVVAVLLVKP